MGLRRMRVANRPNYRFGSASTYRASLFQRQDFVPGEAQIQ